MVLDTSALLAILNDEPEKRAFAAAIARDGIRQISAVTLAEASIVLDRRYGVDAVDDLDLLLAKIGAEVVSVTQDDVPLVREAYRRFGKGRHPAGLNFGDCFSYALARTSAQPLLCKGNDFEQTDIEIVSASKAEEEWKRLGLDLLDEVRLSEWPPFSETARYAFSTAADYAKTQGDYQENDLEAFLVGLLNSPESAIRSSLVKMGVSAQILVQAIHDRAPTSSYRRIDPFLPPTLIVEAARKVAERRGADYIAAVDLLVAALEDLKAWPAEALRAQGMSVALLEGASRKMARSVNQPRRNFRDVLKEP